MELGKGEKDEYSTLTSNLSSGQLSCYFNSPITQYCSHSNGVFSRLLQASQCVHCCTSSDVIGVSETLSVSVGVRDGVIGSFHSISQCQCDSYRSGGSGDKLRNKSII